MYETIALQSPPIPLLALLLSPPCFPQEVHRHPNYQVLKVAFDTIIVLLALPLQT